MTTAAPRSVVLDGRRLIVADVPDAAAWPHTDKPIASAEWFNPPEDVAPYAWDADQYAHDVEQPDTIGPDAWMGWPDGDQFNRAARRGPKPEPWPLAEIIDAQDPSRPAELDRPPLDRPPMDLPDNRAARRSGPFLRHNDLPWYGPIPNVGISSARSRHIHSTGGWPSPDLPRRTPVRVDVVPLIHMRARRAGWSARWSGAEILMQHWGVAPSTTCRRAALIAELAELSDTPRTPETGDGAPTGPPPLQQLDVPTSITPTRGPCHQAGALAGVSRASPMTPPKSESAGAANSDALSPHFIPASGRRTSWETNHVSRYTAPRC